MLISTDLLKYWQRMIPPPAQLCIIRIMGTDNQFILRVRHKEVYLDLPLEVPLSLEDITKTIEMNKIGGQLAAMGAMVVKPGEYTAIYSNYPTVQIGAPIPWDDTRFFHEEYYGS